MSVLIHPTSSCKSKPNITVANSTYKNVEEFKTFFATLKNKGNLSDMKKAPFFCEWGFFLLVTSRKKSPCRINVLFLSLSDDT